MRLFACEEQFEIFIYNNSSREDEKTELFKGFVSDALTLRALQLQASGEVAEGAGASSHGGGPDDQSGSD